MDLGCQPPTSILNTSLGSFDADDLNMLAYPLGGKIDPPAIPLCFTPSGSSPHIDLKLGLSDKRRLFRGREIRVLLCFSHHPFNRPTGIHSYKLVTI